MSDPLMRDLFLSILRENIVDKHRLGDRWEVLGEYQHFSAAYWWKYLPDKITFLDLHDEIEETILEGIGDVKDGPHLWSVGSRIKEDFNGLICIPSAGMNELGYDEPLIHTTPESLSTVTRVMIDVRSGLREELDL